jgi:D-alanyl-lipoteichoic acid acyltransferase DltB (MBOAT superfamily)
MRLIDQLDPNKLLELLKYDQQHPLLFNSGMFLLMFTAFMFVYIAVANRKAVRTAWVILFSLYFYYKCSGGFFVLLILSSMVDYLLGYQIAFSINIKWRKAYMFMSLAFNLGILAYFKYTNLFMETLVGLFHGEWTDLDIFLPVGISFYTFQTMSYTIDVYRRRIEPTHSFMDFFFFVTFFPQLVAGPIVRASNFLPQIKETILVNLTDVGRGLLLICGGLFKKAVISDYIAANFVTRVFEEPTLYTGVENLVAVYGYALQIYCDFSGYSDIAIGLGLLMGFKLPVNFDAPYKSASIQEFWRRWHISLSTWLRDYLYISLGGNRKGERRTYINLMITMLLGGLWHGASWKFVFWGALHGGALAIERYVNSKTEFLGNLKKGFLKMYDRLFKPNSGVGVPIGGVGGLNLAAKVKSHFPLIARIIGIFFTFHFVCFCWMFFQKDATFGSAWEMFNNILTNFRPDITWQLVAGYPMVIALMVLGFALHFVPKRIDQLVEQKFVFFHWAIQALILAVIIWIVIQTRSADPLPFIYYQF